VAGAKASQIPLVGPLWLQHAHLKAGLSTWAVWQSYRDRAYALMRIPGFLYESNGALYVLDRLSNF